MWLRQHKAPHRRPIHHRGRQCASRVQRCDRRTHPRYRTTAQESATVAISITTRLPANVATNSTSAAPIPSATTGARRSSRGGTGSKSRSPSAKSGSAARSWDSISSSRLRSPMLSISSSSARPVPRSHADAVGEFHTHGSDHDCGPDGDRGGGQRLRGGYLRQVRQTQAAQNSVVDTDLRG